MCIYRQLKSAGPERKLNIRLQAPENMNPWGHTQINVILLHSGANAPGAHRSGGGGRAGDLELAGGHIEKLLRRFS